MSSSLFSVDLQILSTTTSVLCPQSLAAVFPELTRLFILMGQAWPPPDAAKFFSEVVEKTLVVRDAEKEVCLVIAHLLMLRFLTGFLG